MRYYEYMSAAKVEMLYPQIAGTRRRTSTEVGVDLKVFRAGRRSEEAAEPSVYEKLAEVEEWIYANEPVGTPDDPQAWIYARCTLAATVLSVIEGGGWRGHHQPEAAAGTTVLSGAVLFADVGHEGWPRLLLGGSATHLTGPRSYPDLRLPTAPAFFSRPVALFDVLQRYAAELELSAPQGPTAAQQPVRDREYEVFHGLAGRIASFDAMADSPRRRSVEATPVVRIGECEVLAKRLRTIGEHSGQGVISLATPLFVALLD